jgi:hypothetical protein
LHAEPDAKVVAIMQNYFRDTVKDAFLYDSPVEALVAIYRKAEVLVLIKLLDSCFLMTIISGSFENYHAW